MKVVLIFKKPSVHTCWILTLKLYRVDYWKSNSEEESSNLMTLARTELKVTADCKIQDDGRSAAMLYF